MGGEMANVRVRYEGTASIIVQDKAWYQDEIHEIDEKLAQALVAFGEQIVVLPVAGGETPGETATADEASADDAGETGTDDAPIDEASADEDGEAAGEVAVEAAASKPKRKR